MTTFARRLGPTHPSLNAIAKEPSLSSAVKRLTSLVATSSKIFTSGRSRLAHANPSAQPPRRSTRRGVLFTFPRRFGFGNRLERHPFSGQRGSVGELLHTPWRIPTSMATFRLSSPLHTLLNLDEPILGTLSERQDDSSSPILLTKIRPTNPNPFSSVRQLSTNRS